jgi:hypothetical protein
VKDYELKEMILTEIGVARPGLGGGAMGCFNGSNYPDLSFQILLSFYDSLNL